MPQAPSSRPRSSRRRRRVLTLPPDAVPRITTTSGPDLTAPFAPVLTRSAHFFVRVVDPVGAVLSSGIWISSFIVALTLATIMHFLDYGRSHRATEFSGAISLPYEAAKWFLNLALRLVPNVSRTLAKVVFIACLALCLIDFGVWCIVTLYRVLFNKVSPDPILVTPFHPDQREELEHQARGPRFQRPSAQVESFSQSPSATACGPSLPPPVQCELSPSSSSSPSPSTPTDLSPDLASSSDTLLSSSSHSWSSGDIISSELTESSSDSSDTDSSTSEEVYIFKAYRAPKVVRPQTQGSGTLFVSAENRLGRDWAMKRRR